jgi:hypothetical protein
MPGIASIASFYLIGVGGIIHFDVENGSVALCAYQVLQGFQRQTLAAAFAVRNDARDAEIMGQDLDRVADFLVVHAGKIIIDDHVIRPLKRSAGQIAEFRRKRVVAGYIDAIDYLDRLGSEPPDCRNGRSHVRYLAKFVANLNWNRGTGQTDNRRRPRRHDHQVRPHTQLALFRSVQQPVKQRHHQQNHGDFKRNRAHRDERPRRPMHQIGDHHLVHHRKAVSTRPLHSD